MPAIKSSFSRAAVFIGCIVLGCLASAAFGQVTAPPPAPTTQPYLREHFTKYEAMIPMRDGVKLYTAYYVPKDDSRPNPILLTRTPYGNRPYGEDGYANPGADGMMYARENFILAFQDVRGRNASGGEFVHMRPQIDVKNGAKDIDESSDAYDTIDWLVKNVPNNNGKVGMYGISYPGFYTAAGMIDSHPALKAASPQAPITDWFIGDDFHHNGTFYLPHCFNFLATFGQHLDEPTRQSPVPFDYKTPDGYQFYLNMATLANADKMYFHGKIELWDDLMNHPTYDDYWQSRNLRPHLKNVKAAVMTVGGWYDAEDLFGELNVFKETEKNNPGINNSLVMGPWFHGGWSGGAGDRIGDVSFNASTSDYYRTNIELPFFKHYLRDDPHFDLPKAYVFECGSDQWRKYDAWPPKNVQEKKLYLQPGSKLSFDSPAGSDTGPASYDEYVSDPAKPVPYIAGTAIGMTRTHMLDDQRFASSRPDVMVYQTDVLDQDTTLAGPLRAELQVSTTGTDSDFIVKLIDVYSGDFPNPDPNTDGVQMGGYEQLVRGEAMRGKFRNSYSNPEPFEPGKVAKVQWVMPDIYHDFRRGHRIMIQVQSTWFPLVDRNPQKFCNIYQAVPEDFQKATERVYHSPEALSFLSVDVLPPAGPSAAH